MEHCPPKPLVCGVQEDRQNGKSLISNVCWVQQHETLPVIVGSSEKSYLLTNDSREEIGGVLRGM